MQFKVKCNLGIFVALTREVWGGTSGRPQLSSNETLKCYQVARGPTQEIHQSSHVNELEISIIMAGQPWVSLNKALLNPCFWGEGM